MQLEEEIRGRAAFDGRLVRIDEFLNHRVEPDLLSRIGAHFAAVVRRHEADAILTAEASGIPPAAATSLASGRPFVYAKKHTNVPDGHLTRRVDSPTKGTSTRYGLDPRFIPPGATLVLVDDVLSGGTTALALIAMAREAGAEVVVACMVVDKAFAGGDARLAAVGVPVEAIVRYGTRDDLPAVELGAQENSTTTTSPITT